MSDDEYNQDFEDHEEGNNVEEEIPDDQINDD